MARPKATPKKSASRTLKTKPYRTFRSSKRIRHAKPILPPARKLFRASLKVLSKNWKLFLSIVAAYFVLTIVMVQRLGIEGGISEAKLTLQDVFAGNGGTLLTGLTLFGYLVSSTGATANETASLYQTILLIVTSLALIWSLRQVQAGNKVQAREAFYKGMYPLIPFVLVFLVIVLQLLPLVIGNWLYSVVVSGGIAVTMAEKTLWIILVVLLSLLSLYMLSSSVFALYISTLPDMTPMKALRSARELVRHRRGVVLRRVLFLPLVMVVVAAIIMIPVIIFITPVAEWLFFGLNMLGLAVVHSYMYSLYRELL